MKLKYLWNTIGNITGLRASVVQDDSAVLSAVKDTLKEAGYLQNVGGCISSSGWQHSVRRLGDGYVIKISPPFEKEKVEKFVNYLPRQRDVLEKYCAPYLTEDRYYLVDLGNGEACYLIVKPWIKGRPLNKVRKSELIQKRELSEKLIDLLDRGEQMYKETGYALDVAEPGMFLSHFLSPEKTGNIIVDKENKLFYIDTVLVPPEYKSDFMPKIYRYSPLWYFIYKYGVQPRARAFKNRLSRLILSNRDDE